MLLDDCHEFADCMNTDGSYECACIDGYQGDGKNCTNINECAIETDEVS